MADEPIFIERPPDVPPKPEDMPRAATLATANRYSTSEMMAYMDRYSLWGDAWPEFVEMQKQYLARMTTFDRGLQPSRRWDEEMQRLTDMQSSKVLTGLSRRVHQQSMTLAACDGDPNTLLAWIDEGDDNTCEVCESLANEEPQTYAERAGTYGQLPGQTCLGGSYCRCDLMAVK